MSGEAQTNVLRVAVVGLGWWGRTLVEQLRDSEKLRVVRLVDIDPGAEDVARRHGVPFSRQLREALADPGVDGVVLCTPHSLHAEQIVAAAGAGKHVFCEKPLCMTRRDVLRATDAIEAAGVALGVGHEKRFEPPIALLLERVKNGDFGIPLQVEANFSQDKFLALADDNWRLSEAEAPAGPLTATGIHLLDLSIGVFGEAETVCASVRQLGSGLRNGDTLAALVSFKRGGHALISAMLATPFAGRFAVFGSNGWCEVRDKSHPEAPEGWTTTTCLRGERPLVVDVPPAPAVRLNLEAFADAAAGRAPYPVPRDEMVANVSALEAIVRSAASGAIERVVS